MAWSVESEPGPRRGGPEPDHAPSAGGRISERRLFTGLLVLAAVPMAMIVTRGGDTWWRIARVALVVGVVAGLYALRRFSRRLAAALAVVVGTVAAATGYALGWDRLRTYGPSRPAAVALLALIAGLGLLVWACAVVVMALDGRLRVAAALVAVLLCRFLVWNFLVMPVAVAIDLTNVPRQPLGELTPADFGLRYRDVSFTTHDSVELRGWYIPSATGRATVLAHGASSNRSSVLPHAKVLAEHGFGVLLFDSRGQGESEGQAMDLGWYGDEDMTAALTFLTAQHGIDRSRLAVVGLSLGGEEAIGTAAIDQRIRAVVAEGASYRTWGDWTPHSSGNWLDKAKDWITFTVADVLSGADPPLRLSEAVRSIAPRPVLLIESGAGLEIEAGRSLRDSAPGNVELWEIPDVGHIGGLAGHPAEWEDHVVDFLEAATT